LRQQECSDASGVIEMVEKELMSSRQAVPQALRSGHVERISPELVPD
jgi:hypothetical protein